MNRQYWTYCRNCCQNSKIVDYNLTLFGQTYVIKGKCKNCGYFLIRKLGLKESKEIARLYRRRWLTNWRIGKKLIQDDQKREEIKNEIK